MLDDVSERKRRGMPPVELDPQRLDLAGIVRAGDAVTWGQAAAEPVPLTEALMQQRQRIGHFGVFLGIPLSTTCRPEHADCVAFSAYCGTGSNRKLAAAGKLDVLALQYSELPDLVRSGALRVDVLLLQVSAANAQGLHSLSLAHEYLALAADRARVVIAEINDRAPWTIGDRALHTNEFDYVVRTSRPPLESRADGTVPAGEQALIDHVCGFIEDRCTLQLGIGAIPEAVLSRLNDRRDLGVHSGIVADGVVRLMRQGVITNAFKNRDTGTTITGLLVGSAATYAFAHANPKLQFRNTDYLHSVNVVASIDRMVAVNSAVEVDLTGQINAESVNGQYVGAVGGAVDFLRGARRSRGGVPIVALPSTAGDKSRIVAKLNGPVTTARSDAGVIVTEHGVADLRGKGLTERVRLMIGVAHPRFRPLLDAAADDVLAGVRRPQASASREGTP